MKISALVITKNEEKNISACLATLSWLDEIIVVDSFSYDSTVNICRKYTGKVYQRAWDNYSSQKNYGHQFCSNDWILSIDADERVSSELAAEIQHVISNGQYDGYHIFIRDYMFGKWVEYGSWPQQSPIRLYRKSVAHWDSTVHEKIKITGNVSTLKNPLLHMSHTSISKFISKMNTYTDIEARNWFKNGVKKSWPLIILSSLRVFFVQYISYQGFRDKGHGFVLAVLLSVYHFVARVKLWELWYKHERNIKDDIADE
jgi:glycosyltransferase involved in cell wall biosynthesis